MCRSKTISSDSRRKTEENAKKPSDDRGSVPERTGGAYSALQALSGWTGCSLPLPSTQLTILATGFAAFPPLPLSEFWIRHC